MSQRGEGFDCEESALVRCVTASAYCEAARAACPLVASVLDIAGLEVLPVGVCVVVVIVGWECWWVWGKGAGSEMLEKARERSALSLLLE